MLNSYLVSHLCCYVNKQISDILIFEYNYTYTTHAGQVDKELVQMMSENCNATTTATTAKRKPNLSLSRVYTPPRKAGADELFETGSSKGQGITCRRLRSGLAHNDQGPQTHEGS